MKNPKTRKDERESQGNADNAEKKKKRKKDNNASKHITFGLFNQPEYTRR